jgi:uncharacterized protein YlxP (DUF503 family)
VLIETVVNHQLSIINRQSSMVVGVCTIELYLPGTHSLKGKRQIVNSLKGRLKNRFNISIAEIDNLDVWQRATLGLTMINTNQKYVDREFNKILNFIESSQYASYLLDYSIEFI